MRRFQVWLSDGAVHEFETSRYEVGDTGDLAIWGGSEVVATFKASSWVKIGAIGTLLSEDWPYPRMERLLDGLCDLLIRRYGGWLHVEEEGLAEWRLNDLDTFVAAICEAASLDPESTDDRPRVREVRRMIAREFELNLPR